MFNVVLADLKSYHLEDYYCFKLRNSNLSAQTIKHHHRIIFKALNEAVKREIIRFNPAMNSNSPKIHKYVGTFLNPV